MVAMPQLASMATARATTMLPPPSPRRIYKQISSLIYLFSSCFIHRFRSCWIAFFCFSFCCCCSCCPGRSMWCGLVHNSLARSLAAQRLLSRCVFPLVGPFKKQIKISSRPSMSFWVPIEKLCVDLSLHTNSQLNGRLIRVLDHSSFDAQDYWPTFA